VVVPMAVMVTVAMAVVVIVIVMVVVMVKAHSFSAAGSAICSAMLARRPLMWSSAAE
jgi:hypothetical protein